MPSLNWAGKDKVINHHLDVPIHVLERVYGFDERGQHEEAAGSGNLIIHGDNLAALKALLPRYEGRVDCIYIDPPYNTGNEGWVYNDNVNDPQIKKWLGEVVGKEGEDFSRHDKWLCMMYPRLRLLHKLLSTDGVIFISIDDNEQARLRLVLDEIFGEGNFVMNITWRRSDNQANIGKVAKVAEYILVYAKDREQLHFGRLPLSEKAKKEYRYSDEKGLFRRSILFHKTRGRRTYPKTTKLGNVLNGPWMVSEEEFDRMDAAGEIYWTESGDGQPYGKIYLADSRGQIANNFWGIEFGTNQQASLELEQIFGKRVFEFPKPSELLTNILSLGTKKNSFILDSFAGSGTTAHAVLKMNAEDGGNRRFILVELMDYAENITAERVKRVIAGYGSDDKAVAGTGGSFDYFELGPALMDGDALNESLPVETLREYVWRTETHAEYGKADPKDPYLLGSHNGTAYYFCYERERTVALNRALLRKIKAKAESYVVFADTCLLDEATLRRLRITFKKIPRDIAQP